MDFMRMKWKVCFGGSNFFAFVLKFALIVILCVLGTSLCAERHLQVFLNSLVQLRGSELQGTGRFVSYFVELLED